MEPTTNVSIFDNRETMDKKIVIDCSTADSINNIYNKRRALDDKQVSLNSQEGDKLDEKEGEDSHHHHLHKRKASESTAPDDSESSESSINLFEDEDEDNNNDECITKAELYSMEKLNKVIMKATSAAGVPSQHSLPSNKQDSKIQEKMGKRDATCNDSLLALATQIGASSISGRTSMNHQYQRQHRPKNDDMILPSPRKYQRRNSFVIRRNRTQKYMFPPSLFRNQGSESNAITSISSRDYISNEESFHQSSPELFLNPSCFGMSSSSQQQQEEEEGLPSSTSNTNSNSTSSRAMEDWGNASWSNTNDTEWYHSSLLTSQVGREPIIPMPSSASSSSSSSFDSKKNTNVFRSVAFPCLLPPPPKSTGSQITDVDKDTVTIVSGDSS